MSANETQAAGEGTQVNPEQGFKVWMCVLCGFLYSEAEGLPDHGIAAGTRWADVPADWICPECSAGKADFEMVDV